MALWILIAVIVILALIAISSYNGLIATRNQADEAWSDIDVQLKRRYDLIPNLVESVKGYAKQESGVLEAVTQARANAISAGSAGIQQKEQAGKPADGRLTFGLRGCRSLSRP